MGAETTLERGWGMPWPGAEIAAEAEAAGALAFCAGEFANHNAYVSLAVVASAAAIAVGLPILDPLIGLAITAVILRITWHSWQTVSGAHTH